MLTDIEMFFLKVLISAASSSELKAIALKELKAAEEAATNPILKVVIEAVEGFLAAA